MIIESMLALTCSGGSVARRVAPGDLSLLVALSPGGTAVLRKPGQQCANVISPNAVRHPWSVSRMPPRGHDDTARSVPENRVTCSHVEQDR